MLTSFPGSTPQLLLHSLYRTIKAGAWEQGYCSVMKYRNRKTKRLGSSAKRSLEGFDLGICALRRLPWSRRIRSGRIGVGCVGKLCHWGWWKESFKGSQLGGKLSIRGWRIGDKCSRRGRGTKEILSRRG